MIDNDPVMIVRSNLEAPDIIITRTDPLESSLESLFSTVMDPSSPHYIPTEYLMFRLIECTNRLTSNTTVTSDPSSSRHCPIIFDSWSCFNSTPAGADQWELCPNFSDLGFVSENRAVKHCGEDGTWWVHPETNR